MSTQSCTYSETLAREELMQDSTHCYTTLGQQKGQRHETVTRCVMIICTTSLLRRCMSSAMWISDWDLAELYKDRFKIATEIQQFAWKIANDDNAMLFLLNPKIRTT